jgi:hypothetical protein
LQTAFHFVRDYEVTKVEQDVNNEFLLIFDAGEEEDLYGGEPSALNKRKKGAYYKNIERKMQLKKKRAQVSTSAIHVFIRTSTNMGLSDSLAKAMPTNGASSGSRTQRWHQRRPRSVQMRLRRSTTLFTFLEEPETQRANRIMIEKTVVHNSLVASGFDDAVDVTGDA